MVIEDRRAEVRRIRAVDQAGESGTAETNS
jgi:hypothetical protein